MPCQEQAGRLLVLPDPYCLLKSHALNNSVLEAIADILRCGGAEGGGRGGLNPLDIPMPISSFCFYRVSNRHTFGALFQIDLSAEDNKQRHKQVICESVLRHVQA